MAVRKNPDGTFTVGVSPGEEEPKPVKAEAPAEEKKPAAKKTVAKKTTTKKKGN